MNILQGHVAMFIFLTFCL